MMDSAVTQRGAISEGTRAGAPSSPFLVRGITTMLVLTVLFQKVAIPFSGLSQIELVLPMNLAFLIYLTIKDYAKINVMRLTLLLTTIAIALFIHVFYITGDFSVPSLLFYAVIYSLYIFSVPISRSDYEKILRNFRSLALLVCALVGLDWAVQLVRLPMPNLEPLIPQQWLFNFYNYIQPLEWKAQYMKPNGIFFLETSCLSQFIATALILEICIFQNVRNLCIFGVSLLSTFGGTGLILVLLSAPLIFLYLRPLFFVCLLVAVPMGVVTASSIGLLDNIQHRSGEFSQEGTSGYQRFVAPFVIIGDAIASPGGEALFGRGAGNMLRAANIAWNPVSKAFGEYGLIFTVVWFLLLVIGMFGRGVPFIVSWMLFMQYHLLNGSFLVPLFTIYCVLLTGLYIIEDEPERQVARPRRTGFEAFRGGRFSPLPARLGHQEARA